MSHASVLVAVDCVDPKDRTEVESLVQFQMEPFDEGDEWFADGSRWDWYQIGGRYTGLLDGYEPREDPANMEICSMCGGTGTRPGGLAQFGKAWFDDCGGCNGCSGKGSRVAFSLKPHAGDIAPVSLVDFSRFQAPYAFLRDRHWHEAERLGWFGSSTATECERNNPGASVEEMIRRCVTKDKNTGARLVIWNEPSEVWELEFQKRFIKPLSPETVLVVVDYHV